MSIGFKDLQSYNYVVPESLIAQEPLRTRGDARLLIIHRQTGKINHDYFRNLSDYIPKDSCIVLNDSKVVPARLFGHKERSAGNVEIFLLKKLKDGYCYEALLRPLKKIKQDDKIIFKGSNVTATIINKENRIIKFNRKDINQFLSSNGHMPLPPYIKRADERIDKTYYQTVFAKRKGSVAAPTAGLHFTNAQLKQLKCAGHAVEYVTLHVNYATFKPVEESNICKHVMHSEEYEMKKNVYKEILKAKNAGRKVVSVGTTSCRVIESVGQTNNLKGQTGLFIYPGFKFQLTDILITNFHFPCSSLLMLVYAFGGFDLMKKAYALAVKCKYRFFSYGDAMIII